MTMIEMHSTNVPPPPSLLEHHSLRLMHSVVVCLSKVFIKTPVKLSLNAFFFQCSSLFSRQIKLVDVVCVCVRLAEDFFVLTLVSHIALRGRVKDIGVCVKCACAAGVPVDSFIHFVWDMACAGHRIGLSLPFYLIPLRSFFQITFTCPVIPAATARATAPTTTVTLALLWRRCLHSTALGSGYDDCSQQESSLNQYQAQSTVPIKKALVEQKNKFFV